MVLEDFVAWYSAFPVWLIFLISAWSLVWKGLALWKSSKLNKPVWFVVLLVVNTVGLLEILYLFVFSKMGKKKEVSKKAKKR